MNCRGLKTLLNVARKQLVIEKRAKKAGFLQIQKT